MANVSIVDDSDPRIQYSPASEWGRGGAYPEYDNTTHWTTAGGANASFVFVGTNVSVYGTIVSLEGTGGGAPIVTFSVDGSDQVTYSPVPMPGRSQYNQQFYTSPLFRDEQHTIVVTKYQDSSPLYLDYFAFESLPSETTSPVPASSTQPSSASGTTSPAGASSTNNPSSSGASSGSTVSSSKAGAIVGGCIGGLILIVLVTIILLRRRYRRPQPDSRSYIASYGTQTTERSHRHGAST